MAEPHGVFGGSRVGFLEHEIANWIRARVRADTGEPVGTPLPEPENLRIISVNETASRVGFSRVQIWRLEKQGRFPRRVRVLDAAE
jgi:predicted DNA-binding transcriptional regulator AlpA